MSKAVLTVIGRGDTNVARNRAPSTILGLTLDGIRYGAWRAYNQPTLYTVDTSKYGVFLKTNDSAGKIIICMLSMIQFARYAFAVCVCTIRFN